MKKLPATYYDTATSISCLGLVAHGTAGRAARTKFFEDMFPVTNCTPPVSNSENKVATRTVALLPRIFVAWMVLSSFSYFRSTHVKYSALQTETKRARYSTTRPAR